jgi:hypothetical protein
MVIPSAVQGRSVALPSGTTFSLPLFCSCWHFPQVFLFVTMEHDILFFQGQIRPTMRLITPTTGLEKGPVHT